MTDLQQIELDLIAAYKKYIPLIDEDSYVNGATIVRAIDKYTSIIYNDIKKGLIEAGYNPDKPKQRHIHELTAMVFYSVRPDFRRVKLAYFQSFWDNKENYKLIAKNQILSEHLEEMRVNQERKERIMAKWSARKRRQLIQVKNYAVEDKVIPGELVERQIPKELEGIFVRERPTYYARTTDPIKIPVIDIKTPEHAVKDRLEFQEVLAKEIVKATPAPKYDSILPAYLTVGAINFLMLFGAIRYVLGVYS